MYPVCWCSLLQCWGGGEGALRQRGMRRGPCSRGAPEGREETYVRSLYIYIPTRVSTHVIRLLKQKNM